MQPTPSVPRPCPVPEQPGGLPERPEFPQARVVLETPAGSLWFDNEEEMKAWKAEPWWRKLTGRTAYDRRLQADLLAQRPRPAP